MPTNLNALIRYKQIDACLRNPYVKCTIERLQETCSEAMGEFRGIYKLVSKRTIRDDIRVMRSNILGFNAPIEYEEGKYFYSDKDYSIFKTPVTDIKLLKDIFKVLVKERDRLDDWKIDSLLFRISILTGEPYFPEKKILINPGKISDDKISRKIEGPEIMPELKILQKTVDKRPTSINYEKKPEPMLSWKEILSILNIKD